MAFHVPNTSSFTFGDTFTSTFGAGFAEAFGNWTVGDVEEPSPFPYPQSVESKYDFRLQARENTKPTVVAWLDEDESGNYDPSARGSRQLAYTKPKRERLLLEDDENRELRPKRPKLFTWLNGRNLGYSFPITLRLKSESGKLLLASGIDNWPFDGVSSKPTSSDDFAFSDRSHTPLLSQPTEQSQPYQFRTRSALPYSDCDQLNVPSIEHATLGHPAARGCKACLSLALPCTLIQEGATYPCEDCVQDGYDCELIISPPKKRSCQQCRRRRFSCSYLEEGFNHDKPCTACTSSNVKCIAGPASGRTRVGPAYDQFDHTRPVSPLQKPDRPFVKCAPCRRAKKWCSLRKNQAGPCKRCIAGGTDCTFESLRPLGLKSRLRLAQRARTGEGARSREEPMLEAQRDNSEVRTTRLAQPLFFNHIPTENVQCNWCLDLCYGIIGLQTHTVDDRGKSPGYSPSYMCSECTLMRLKILACESHELLPLDGIDPETFDQGQVLDVMMDGKAAEAPWEWCDICPQAALWGCGKKGTEEEGEGEEEGCGLRLCEECAMLLLEHGGEMEDVVYGRMGEDAFGVRADAELLLPTGGLMKSLEVMEGDGAF